MQLKQLFSSYFTYSILCVNKKPYAAWSVDYHSWLAWRLWAQIGRRIRGLAVFSACYARLSHFADNLGLNWWRNRELKIEDIKGGVRNYLYFSRLASAHAEKAKRQAAKGTA
jgi:hypothetical protein